MLDLPGKGKSDVGMELEGGLPDAPKVKYLFCIHFTFTFRARHSSDITSISSEIKSVPFIALKQHFRRQVNPLTHISKHNILHSIEATLSRYQFNSLCSTKASLFRKSILTLYSPRQDHSEIRSTLTPTHILPFTPSKQHSFENQFNSLCSTKANLFRKLN